MYVDPLVGIAGPGLVYNREETNLQVDKQFVR